LSGWWGWKGKAFQRRGSGRGPDDGGAGLFDYPAGFGRLAVALFVTQEVRTGRAVQQDRLTGERDAGQAAAAIAGGFADE
jgi:hypothetical protein